MKKESKSHIETVAIHAGMDHLSASRAVSPPLEPSTNFEHSERGYQEGDLAYSRAENPNRSQLEKVLTALEGGKACASFSSGIAAMNSVLSSLDKGAHIIIPEDVYHGSRMLLMNYAQKWSVEFTSVNMSDLNAYEKAFQDNTKLVIIETPSNPLMLITDIAKAASVAHEHGAMVCADNTFATPFNTNPLKLGADLVMNSTSKYLGGHSDILGGAVIAAEQNEFFEKIRMLQISQGAVPSPRDCWLLSRSIRSFPYRMRGHNENAAKVAEFLEGSKGIKKVNYPGLKSHPGHETAKKQMKGFGGMISFLIEGGTEEALNVVSASRIIKQATSLGGIESLWEHRRSSESETSTTPENLIRLSVGLEHIDDLLEDIEQSLNKLTTR